MIGLLFIFIVGAWLFLAYGLVKLITIKVPQKPWRAPLRAALYVGLLPLPILDELVGVSQFHRVCRENSAITVDRTKAAGKTLFRADLPGIDVEGTWIPIRLTPWRFHDVTTQELVVSYNTVRVSGGRFIRAFPLWEGGTPLLLGKSYCQPDGMIDPTALLKELGVSRLEDPVKGTRGGR